MELLSLSAAWMFEDAHAQCWAFLEDSVTEENVLMFVQEAFGNGLGKVSKPISKFVGVHCGAIIQTDGFLDLPSECVSYILSHKQLQVASNSLFTAILRWTRHDLKNRHCDLARHLAHLTLPLVTPSLYSELLGTLLNDDIDALIASAQMLHSHARYSSELYAMRVLTNRIEDFHYYVLTDQGELYTESDDSSLALKFTFKHKGAFVAIYHEGMFYMLTCSGTIETFDPHCGARSVTSIPVPHLRVAADSALALLHDKLYIFGGGSAIVDRLDIRSFTWDSVADFPGGGVRGPAVAVIHDRILLFGGRAGHDTGNNNVYQYNLDSSEWVHLVQMANVRYCLTAVVDPFVGKVLLVGGYADGTDEARTWVHYFDPITHTFDVLPPLSKGVARAGIMVESGHIKVFGGLGNYGTRSARRSSLLFQIQRKREFQDGWTKRVGSVLPIPMSIACTVQPPMI
jgi:hypothetical protein